ncbi:alpha/beta hydrolase family protein [Candidatus Bipolaricaulota bacterium]
MSEIASYDFEADLGIRWIGSREQDGVTESDLTFLVTPDQMRAASLVRPAGDGPFPVILYVHWYETHACDSNRTQFLEEAKAMAAKGIMSLLVETMWSDREWFLKRTQADDYDSSIKQIVELRRAMDLLLSQPGADLSRFAYVGHDFGAMYGVSAGSIDLRPTCYVLMAGTPRLPDWFLYYPKLEGDDRGAFVQQMAPLDPIERVGQLSPAPILFQFGKNDPHVPTAQAEDFFEAASEPKELRWYDAGHGLSEQASAERVAWLLAQLA